MASPQLENGHLKIADSLVVAITRNKFSAVQIRMLLAIMLMTYRVGKTKAEIGIEDMRYATGEKRYTLETALEKLIAQNVVFCQHLKNGGTILGIQKDFDKWQPTVPKIGNTNTNVLAVSNIKPSKELPKIGKTPPERLLNWVLQDLNLKLSLTAWRKERKVAILLYTKALELAHSPLEALVALKDYYSTNADASFRARVIRPMAYLEPGFEKWFKQIPKKPRSIREDEEVTGYRFRYNHIKHDWEMTGEKLKSNH